MAFRSLSRLSSALSAKASTLRSFLLNFLLQCVALHCFVLLSHLSMIPYLSFDRRVRDFSRHRICFFDVLLIINGYLSLSLYEVLKVHSALNFALFTHVLTLSKSFLFSGAEGIRTPDPLLARQVLSQLSYTPMGWFSLPSGLKWTRTTDLTLIRRAL